MSLRTPFSLLLVLGFAAGCTDGGPLAPAPDGRLAAAPAAAPGSTPSVRRIVVMTRNLYIGANVDAVITALASSDPSDDFPALLAAIETLGKTDFPTRAAALADEIGRARPHVVGLQEVDQLEVDLTGFGLPVTVSLDFLATLQAELAARGLNYTVAGQVTNIATTPVPGVTLIDHDAILVDADRVSVGPGVIAQTFTFNIGVVAPGVDLKRGWVQIDAMIEGMPVTVASTHLESGSGAGLSGLRAVQAAELLTSVGAASPAILLGDFNDTPGSAMHTAVTGAGFSDTWASLRPGVRGFTCCELADLSNQVPVLHERIDYVFVRGIGGPRGKLLGQVTIIGDQPADRVPGPFYKIWPSDHAGVVANFLMPPALGLAATP